MLNNVTLVGRLTDNPVVTEKETGKKMSYITLAVPRSFKNPDGSYDCDFIRCVLWNNIAANTCEYCKVGDIVGIKGRIQTRVYDDEQKNRKYITEIVAEKVSFISSNKKEPE